MFKNAILTTTLVLVSFCISWAEEGTAPAVRVVNPRRGKISRWLATSGFVTPRVICSITAQVDGRVKSIAFDVGDRIDKEVILLTLENPALQITLRRAKAVLALRQATLDRLMTFREAEANLELAMAHKDLKVARAELVQTKATYESKAKLSNTGMVPGQEMQAAKAAFVKAQAQVDYLSALVSHRKKLQQKKDWLRDVEKARAERDAAKEDVARAQLDVDRLNITCPIKGRIALRQVAIGQSVRVGNELFSVIDSSQLYIDCYVDEQMVTAIKDKQKALISFDGSPLPLDGEVLRIAPSVDSEKGGYLVRLLILEKAGSPRAGRYATCRILLEERQGVLLIPRSAIVEMGGQQFLYVVSDETVTEQVIETGLEENDSVEIRSGINQAQKVVIEGAHGLSDGQAVRVVGEGSAP